MTDTTWDIEPAYEDLAWTDEVYDEEEYPFVLEEDDYDSYFDGDLPGMWEKADFE